MKFIFIALLWPILVFSTQSRLSQTGLYKDIVLKSVDDSHLYFEPQYALWSDGARKVRWIQFPQGSKIDTADPDRWVFPTGTKVWKEFSFPIQADPSHFKRVETRYLEKQANGTWIVATYLWNADESDADLAPTEGVRDYYLIQTGVKHDIPSVRQCGTCHDKGGDKILGFDPLQLSDDRDPLALHRQTGASETVTLKTLLEKNLVKKQNPNWISHPPRIHSRTDLGRAAMGYLHGNCGHCHSSNGAAAGTKQFLRHSEKAADELGEPAYSTTVNKKTNFFQIPGQNTTYRVLPGEPELSAVHYRLNAGSMPSLGKKIVDRDAVEQIGSWIKTLK